MFVTSSYLEKRKKEIRDEIMLYPLTDEVREIKKLIDETDKCSEDEAIEKIAFASLSLTGLKFKVKPIDWFKYFDMMYEEERNLVKEWHSNQIPKTKRQENFLTLVANSLKFIDYNYRIANIEPSIDSNKRIFYREGEVVGQGIFSFKDWKDKATYFSPQYGSSLATVYELLLWYAYRIAKGYWSIEYACDNSLSAGNYWESPDSSHDFEVSGKREVGGARDGAGNTIKVVMQDGEFFTLGCFCRKSKDFYPVACLTGRHTEDLSRVRYNCIGVIVLKNLG